ncbi:MAG TPA: hypothetical protein VJS12_23260 [Steroidobacteraceae bacterium]|nr:hypothetical protein [Steroidobacteraceae bacterium]
MSNEVTFIASRSNALGGVILYLGMPAFMIWIGFGKSLFGLALIIFIGLYGAYYALVLLRPEAMYLRLDEEGLEIGGVLGGKQRIKWADMRELRLARTAKGLRVLKIFYSPPPSSTSGRPLVCSIDAEYSAPLTEILATLEQWRKRLG